MTRRTERIGEQLREALAAMLHREVTDPRVAPVTVTHVDVAPDLSHAIVAWSALDVRGGADIDEIAAGLDSAAAFLRRRLAKELALRRMPELRFQHDPSIERGSEMTRLLREIDAGGTRASDAGDPPETPSGGESA